MMQPHAGRWLWWQLHTFTEKIDQSPEQRKAWLANWFATVKKLLGCDSCYKKLERFCNLWEPPLNGDLHAWGMCLHDYVNHELGRGLAYPELTLAPLKERGIVH